MTTPTNAAIVEVQSPWLSKTNWLAGVSMLAAVLSIFNVKFPPEIQTATVDFVFGVANLVSVAGPILIWVNRTWFSKTVSSSAVAGAPTVRNDASVPQMAPAAPIANMIPSGPVVS